MVTSLWNNAPDRIKELIRFCLVGGISFLIDFGLLYVLTTFGGIHYLYSSGISFTVSVLINYWLCVHFVFVTAKEQSAFQATLFFGSSLVGLGINQFCMWLFVDVVGIYFMIAKIIATIIVTAWNYVAKRKAVYGNQ